MRALLDVNVLIALLDRTMPSMIARTPGGTRTGKRMGELSADGEWGRADHVESQLQPPTPADAGGSGVADREVCRQTDHGFWPDDVSLRDDGVFDRAGCTVRVC